MQNNQQPKPPLWLRLTALAVAAALVGVDHLIKRWAVNTLAPGGAAHGGAVTAIPGVLGLQYTENTGISFSMFGDSRAAMYVVTAITGAVMLAGVIALLAGRLAAIAPLWSGTLILAGGVGNLIDRVAQGYVVDCFEFLFVRFAVFNFADICISAGVVWLAGWVLFGEVRRKKAAA